MHGASWEWVAGLRNVGTLLFWHSAWKIDFTGLILPCTMNYDDLMMNTVTVDGELCVLQSDISMLLKSALSIGPHMRSIGSFQNVALPGDEGAKLPYISLRCLLRTY